MSLLDNSSSSEGNSTFILNPINPILSSNVNLIEDVSPWTTNDTEESCGQRFLLKTLDNIAQEFKVKNKERGPSKPRSVREVLVNNLPFKPASTRPSTSIKVFRKVSEEPGDRPSTTSRGFPRLTFDWTQLDQKEAQTQTGEANETNHEYDPNPEKSKEKKPLLYRIKTKGERPVTAVKPHKEIGMTKTEGDNPISARNRLSSHVKSASLFPVTSKALFERACNEIINKHAIKLLEDNKKIVQAVRKNLKPEGNDGISTERPQRPTSSSYNDLKVKLALQTDRIVFVREPTIYETLVQGKEIQMFSKKTPELRQPSTRGHGVACDNPRPKSMLSTRPLTKSMGPKEFEMLGRGVKLVATKRPTRVVESASSTQLKKSGSMPNMTPNRMIQRLFR